MKLSAPSRSLPSLVSSLANWLYLFRGGCVATRYISKLEWIMLLAGPDEQKLSESKLPKDLLLLKRWISYRQNTTRPRKCLSLCAVCVKSTTWNFNTREVCHSTLVLFIVLADEFTNEQIRTFVQQKSNEQFFSFVLNRSMKPCVCVSVSAARSCRTYKPSSECSQSPEDWIISRFHLLAVYLILNAPELLRLLIGFIMHLP